MIPHLPPRSPSDPSRQNTSTYLRERRDKKINDCTLNYIATYQASVPFVSSGGDRTPLYISTTSAAAYWEAASLQYKTKKKCSLECNMAYSGRASSFSSAMSDSMRIYQALIKRLCLRYTTKDKDLLKGAYNLESALECNQDAVKPETNVYLSNVEWWQSRVCTGSRKQGTKPE